MNDLTVGNGTAVIHLKYSDWMCITNYQIYMHPKLAEVRSNTKLPFLFKFISVLLKNGNLALIIFGAVSKLQLYRLYTQSSTIYPVK